MGSNPTHASHGTHINSYPVKKAITDKLNVASSNSKIAAPLPCAGPNLEQLVQLA